MLNLKKGCFFKEYENLTEQYEINDNWIRATVDVQNIEALMKEFISMQDELMFFILELPTNEKEEKIKDSNCSHKDVYYIDGLDKKACLNIMEEYGELLINDGLVQFGFGVHATSDELMSEQYNVMTLLSNDIEKYSAFFASHDIPLVDKCVTAWNTFTESTPGMCRSIRENGLLVYDLPEKMADMGIYFAERREEN